MVQNSRHCRIINEAQMMGKSCRAQQAKGKHCWPLERARTVFSPIWKRMKDFHLPFPTCKILPGVMADWTLQTALFKTLLLWYKENFFQSQYLTKTSTQRYLELLEKEFKLVRKSLWKPKNQWQCPFQEATPWRTMFLLTWPAPLT